MKEEDKAERFKRATNALVEKIMPILASTIERKEMTPQEASGVFLGMAIACAKDLGGFSPAEISRRVSEICVEDTISAIKRKNGYPL